MGLAILKPYEVGSLSHNGTMDTGKGVGLRPGEPSPGFAAGYDAYLDPMNGVKEYPCDYWVHDGYLYLVYNATASVYRFAIDADGNLTPDSSQTMANMGLVGTDWMPYNPAQYDPASRMVILCSYYGSAASGKTPVIGMWDCDDWPFTSGNAQWLSSMQQSYQSFTSGQLCNYGPAIWNTTTQKLYVCSCCVDQVCRIDTADGSVDGFFEPYTAYHQYYGFWVIGFDSSNYPIGGGYAAASGGGGCYVWDDTNPASWSKGATALLEQAASLSLSVPTHRRNIANWYGVVAVPLSEHEKSLIGDPDVAWKECVRDKNKGEVYLNTYDFATSEHSHRSMAQAGDRRAIGNSWGGWFSERFVEIGGVPWLVSYNKHSQDVEDENPGVDCDLCGGLMLTPLGPGTVTYTVPPEEVPDGTPKQLVIGIAADATNTLFSDSPAKHRVRMKVNNGSWSSWRTGTRQMQALDQVVDGLAAWPSFSAGDTLTIEHSMVSGWPNSFAPTKGNPGAGGDPTPVEIHTADIGVPREVMLQVFYETALPDEGKTFGRPIGVDAHIIKPESISAEITS